MTRILKHLLAAIGVLFLLAAQVRGQVIVDPSAEETILSTITTEPLGPSAQRKMFTANGVTFIFLDDGAGSPANRAKKKISNVVRLKGSGARSDTRQYAAKRNVLTIKNLKPGRYTASYHVQVKQDGKVVVKTKESPKRKLTVTG